MSREVKRAVTSCNLSFSEGPWPRAVIRRISPTICVACRLSVCIVEELPRFCCRVSPSMVRDGVGVIGWSLMWICMGGGQGVGRRRGVRMSMWDFSGAHDRPAEWANLFMVSVAI